MPWKKTLISDLNGEEVTEENAAKIVVSFANSDEVHTLDITADEARDIITSGDGSTVGKTTKKRGRKAADANGQAPANEAAATAAKK